jgi:hemoglobin
VADEPTVYEAAGGAEGLTRLAAAWHERVLADEVVEHAFSHGYRADHVPRLAAYWAETLGGPEMFTRELGDESAVVRRHSCNGPHEEMNDRAIACFDAALVDTGLAEDDRLRQTLHDWFAWATRVQMTQFEGHDDVVPDDLPLPHWGWDGPQV